MLNNKINELTALVTTENYDILMVTETWFSKASVPNIKGYDIFHKDRSTHAGGFFIYSKSSLSMSKIANPKFNDHEVEQIWCTFTKGFERFLVEINLSAETSRSIKA